MANSIFPDSASAGGIVIRDAGGVCLNPADVHNAYCPPATFVTSCELTALPSDCNARIEPRQINAIVSELLALAECFDANGPWNCSLSNNLCAAFTAWAAANKSLIYVGNDPPAGVPDNVLWWDADGNILYVKLGGSWVPISVDTSLYLLKSGGTMTGALTLAAGSPVGGMDAAPASWSDGRFVRYDAVQGLSGVQQAQARANIGVSATTPPSCGRLVYVSATSIKYIPFNGDTIRVAGVSYQIPAAGISKSNAGLTASTTYYAYLTAALAIELSTTAWAWDTTAGNVGIAIKTGDPTRSLIGMIRADSSSQFRDDAAVRWVATWLNRRPRALMKTLGLYSTTSGTAVEYGAGAERLNFLVWAGDAIDVTYSVSLDIADNGAAASTSITQTMLDGTAVGGTIATFSGIVGSSVYAHSQTFTIEPATEGNHFSGFNYWSQLAGATTAGLSLPHLTAKVFI